ncbi:MAG: toll/interleukin-1 receptor domain-containing protein, partial [Candidatus Poribacteria bacterium]|nr:toll/interleukin-1 receptor domain-containing protein [Candidatus Poribacteria bacterium]
MDTMEEVEFDYETYTRENPPDLSKARRGPEVRRERREAFRARLINHVNMEIKHARKMKHVFISYCHENKTIVDRLCQALASHDIHIWLDRDNIGPGTPWKQAIQQAIHHGDFFLACFSKEYNARDKTFMEEELSIAIEKFQQKLVDKIWFIPVKLNECEIPDIDIGGGETLRNLKYVD